MPYDIAEHQHRYAAWAATRGAMRGIRNLKIAAGNRLLTGAGLRLVGDNPNALPAPADFDAQHARWRAEMIRLALPLKIELTHGIAAKLINLYLKERLVCGGYHQHAKVAAIHPPFDGKLLIALVADREEEGPDCWNALPSWTSWNTENYDTAVRLAKARMARLQQPLWMIEELWTGF